MKRYLILCLFCVLGVLAAKATNVHTKSYAEPSKPVYGMQMWYAPLLGSNDKRAGNKKRLKQELDSLKALGVNTISVLAGTSFVSEPIDTTNLTYGRLVCLQEDESLLKGLDYVLNELRKRNMGAVVSITKQWNDANVSDERCKDFVQTLAKRKNSYSKIAYSTDNTIVAWQICDVPNVSRMDSLQNYILWCAKQAQLLKQSGMTQPVTIVYKPIVSCEAEDERLFQSVMGEKNFDMVSVSFNPQQLGWVVVGDLYNALGKVYNKVSNLLQTYVRIAQGIDKPFVLTDCAYPRTAMFTRPATNTDSRDSFFSFLKDEVNLNTQGDYSYLKGIMFNGWGGNARPTKDVWIKPYDFTSEYPDEQKGSYAIFDNDESTLRLLRSFFSK